MATSLATKAFIRQPYAWPGGYPLFALCHDGGTLCHKCCKKEFRNIVASHLKGIKDGWYVVAIETNWEDTALHCDHCGAPIESAYGEES